MISTNLWNGGAFGVSHNYTLEGDLKILVHLTSDHGACPGYVRAVFTPDEVRALLARLEKVLELPPHK